MDYREFNVSCWPKLEFHSAISNPNRDQGPNPIKKYGRWKSTFSTEKQTFLAEKTTFLAKKSAFHLKRYIFCIRTFYSDSASWISFTWCQKMTVSEWEKFRKRSKQHGSIHRAWIQRWRRSSKKPRIRPRLIRLVSIQIILIWKGKQNLFNDPKIHRIQYIKKFW
jgi:hypothetical protein